MVTLHDLKERSRRPKVFCVVLLQYGRGSEPGNSNDAKFAPFAFNKHWLHSKVQLRQCTAPVQKTASGGEVVAYTFTGRELEQHIPCHGQQAA